jgi:apolipoprotein N-acyltransferase
MLKRLALPILSGFLIGTSYIPFPPWALFFCQVPLWIFWYRETSAKQAFWGGWLTQFILNAIGFHWIAHTATEFGNLPWWGGFLVLMLFCSLAHLYYPLAGYCWKKLTLRYDFPEWCKPLLLISLFAFFEWIYPTIFPWHMGYPWLWARLPGFNFADVIGFEGLNLLTLTVNACLLYCWFQRRTYRRALAPLAAAVLLFALPNALGEKHGEPWKKTDAQVNVLVIQGNIGNLEKVYAQAGRFYQTVILDKFLSLSEKGLREHPETNVLLWPETAFPDNLDLPYQTQVNSTRLQNFLASKKIPLLTGAYSQDPQKKEVYNGLFFLDESGHHTISPYRKTILLPFGEYFPGAQYAPFLLKLFPEVSTFGRGSGPRLFAADNWKVGPQICYEGLFPEFSGELSHKGAEWFVNVTNDSWFGAGFEPRQHLYMTLARAIEFRRPLIRATNTGISAAILADGEVLTPSPLFEEWTGLYKILYKRNPTSTIYEKIVPYTTSVLAFVCILLIVYGRERTRRSRLERNSKQT